MSSIDARLARLETLGEALLRDVSRLDRDVEALAPIVGQVIEFVAEVKSLGDDISEIKADVRNRAGMSTTLKVALISGCFALAVALIAAIAQIVGH